jgi:AcrR family transcriptional regulator
MGFSQSPSGDDRPRIPGSRSPIEPARLVPRGKHNVPREFIEATQRERLLDAVAIVVGQRGYQAATITDIVAAAGVSTKTFYEHFDDKLQCFNAAYDFGIGILYSHVRAAYEQEKTWVHKIRAGIEVLLGILAAEPAFARLCVVEIYATGPAGIERRQAVISSFRAFFDVPARGERVDLQTVIRATIGGIYECIYEAVVEGRTAELTELAGPLVYVALLPFVGPSKARSVSLAARSASAAPRVAFEEVRSPP